MKKWILLLLITQMLFGVISCKKEEEQVKPEVEIPQGESPFVAPNVMDENTRAIISEIDTSDFTFVFKGESEITKTLEVGSILVDSASEMAPYGYLRKVKSINSKDGELTIQTEQAVLTDIAEEASIRFSTGQLNRSHIQKVVFAEGVNWSEHKDPNFSVFSFDYRKSISGSNGEFVMEGHTSLDMEFFFNFDWEWVWELDWSLGHPVVKLFESGVIIDQAASIQTQATGIMEIDKKRYSLASFYFTPWTFMVGPVPVVFYPRIELFLELDGSVTAEFTAGASEDFHAELGVRYTLEDDWREISNYTYTTDFSAPNMSMDVNYTADIGPEISLLLYGVAGPFANVTAFGQLSSHLEGVHGYWDLDFIVGSRAEVGVLIDVLGFREDKAFLIDLFRDTLLHYDNEPFGNAIYLDNPINGSNYALGNNIMLTASYTGSVPDQVVFNINDDVVFQDDDAPFEYLWETEGLEAGAYEIKVKEMLGGVKISEDDAMISLQQVFWSEIDLNDLGIGDNTRCTDFVFFGSNDAWMTTSEPGAGKLLKTVDGGDTWQVITASNLGIEKMNMFNSSGQGFYLTSNQKVYHTADNGLGFEELEYGNEFYTQPTFQWKDIFGIGTNLDGEIIAVGKDTGIPYQFEIYRANSASHEPISDYGIPHPNEYGYPPQIYTRGNTAIVYGIQDENVADKSYYLTSNDGGLSWIDHEFGGVTLQDILEDAAILNEDQWWIVGQNENGAALVLITENAGQSWEVLEFDDIDGFHSVHFVDANEGYATINKLTSNKMPKLYQTLDGGHSWDPVFGVESIYGMEKVSFIGNELGVVIGQGPIIYKFGIGD
ncbi:MULTISPECIES: Ig-like domain-containing protein [unclassified Lentimicrobium]|uniref:Ig-like domain-containing protein n=1 Tax=unclassified Lentimicrobium TaxID=2677434 RepID=UPI00155556BD|nr:MULTISPECIES: Ig-like domain-containing protein [unclassified Lentimicrobium]NPD44748.1 hypothetical protein [Lentimicrobium sp. S6]NPD83396.1 hypothetical protein [Lentimicrobium sp. L6]